MHNIRLIIFLTLYLLPKAHLQTANSSYTDRVRIAYYRQTRFNSERNTSTPRAADNITLRTGIHPISSSTLDSHVLNSGYYMQPIFTHTTYSQRAYFIKKCILGINTQTPGKVKCFYLRIPRVIELLNQEAKLSPLSMLKSLLSQLL